MAPKADKKAASSSDPSYDYKPDEIVRDPPFRPRRPSLPPFPLLFPTADTGFEVHSCRASLHCLRGYAAVSQVNQNADLSLASVLSRSSPS